MKSVFDSETETESETMKAVNNDTDVIHLSTEAVPTVEMRKEEESSVQDAVGSDPVIDALLFEIKSQGLEEPVEILRFLQKNIIRGRELDVDSMSDTNEGETNYVCVDRNAILTTTFSELEEIQDFRITFEVDFISEMAKDLGGPRK